MKHRWECWLIDFILLSLILEVRVLRIDSAIFIHTWMFVNRFFYRSKTYRPACSRFFERKYSCLSERRSKSKGSEYRLVFFMSTLRLCLEWRSYIWEGHITDNFNTFCHSLSMAPFFSKETSSYISYWIFSEKSCENIHRLKFCVKIAWNSLITNSFYYFW